jgi:hypothetical protein
MKSDYEKNWDTLYEEMGDVLSKYGVEAATRADGDYWIVDRPHGYDQQKVYFSTLKMLDPKIIYALQELLKRFSSWEIFTTVFTRPPDGDTWPEMGLIIRRHEIIDGLQRQYFPPEYQSIQYEGSRVGTDKD